MQKKLIASLTALAVLLLALAIATGYGAYVAIQEYALRETEKQAVLRATALSLRFSAIIEEPSRPLAIFSGMSPLAAAIRGYADNGLEDVNAILDRCVMYLDADVCYLMDAAGLTIASSNRESPDSFVGNNYHFRPYFQQALSGSPSAYLARGITSEKRGLYYAYPVGNAVETGIEGVLVAKSGVDRIESYLGEIDPGNSDVFLVADPHGIVFISNRQEWLFHSLFPLSDAEAEALSSTSQFGPGPFPSIGIQFQQEQTLVDPAGCRYVVAQQPIAAVPGWKVYQFIRLDENARIFGKPVSMWMAILGLCLAVVLAAVVSLYLFSLGYLRRIEKSGKALAESEAKFRDVMDMIPVAVWETDLEGNLTLINPAGIALFGYTKAEMTATFNVFHFLVPEEHERARSSWSSLLQGGVSKMTQYTLIKKDGTRFPALIRSVLKTMNGLPAGFRGIIVDMSEKVKEEEEKQQMQRMIEKSRQLDYIAGLAGGIAHHFNNLMMGIMGNAALIALDLEENDPNRRKLQHIEELVKRGARLTSQLLGFAQGGKYIVEETNMNRLIQQVVDSSNPEGGNIDVLLDLTKETYALRVDRKQMEQVITDILQNAVQAMPNGGWITIRSFVTTINRVQADRNDVRPGRYFGISVQDTGIGMDETIVERIFEPFFTTREIGAGVGLSMAAAYGVIRNHGGFITVQSKIGKGSAFGIYLPCGEDSMAGGVETVNLDAGKGTVLLVDDDEMILDIGTGLLEKLGYRVLVADGGEKAIQIYQAKMQEIDLVILDLVMPVMDGEALFDALKAMNPQIKVIVSSGYPIDGKANEILKKGGNAFIQKPFSMKTFSEKIKTVLEAALST
ncbi:hybrid sensor histidine kinase/response regulator [Desulfatirhabdium butyrativorans]|uniref:hybrid sensor histidine kinase/response regulator n=1 Tax=Desulfatirhabdium butyrativorans TaxID=340467 RepID=UPI000402F990|nr:response regulator [Desulfatirhabdium butyrativorans]